MILKEKSRAKKNKKFLHFNTFLFINFILTTSIGILFLVFFFTSHTVKLKTQKVLDYLSKAGRYEYIYIFDIAWMAFKSNFSKLEKINMEIDFENILINKDSKTIISVFSTILLCVTGIDEQCYFKVLAEYNIFYDNCFK